MRLVPSLALLLAACTGGTPPPSADLRPPADLAVAPDMTARCNPFASCDCECAEDRDCAQALCTRATGPGTCQRPDGGRPGGCTWPMR